MMILLFILYFHDFFGSLVYVGIVIMMYSGSVCPGCSILRSSSSQASADVHKPASILLLSPAGERRQFVDACRLLQANQFLHADNAPSCWVSAGGLIGWANQVA
jgi:hypothetical protein